MIDGKGTAPVPGGGERVVHDAFATLAWDAAQNRHVMHAYRADGGAVTDTPVLSDGRMVWGFTVPNGPRIRYTLNRTAEVWHEIGEYSMGSDTWTQFLEMTLHRVK